MDDKDFHPMPNLHLAMDSLDNEDKGYQFSDFVARNEPDRIVAKDGELQPTLERRIDKVPTPVQIRTPAIIHYPRARDVIQVISGTDINERKLGFDCRAIVVQNVGTNGFLYCPELNMYLTSGSTSLVTFNLPSSVEKLSFVWHTAAFNTASPAGVAGQYANVWVYDEWVPPVSALAGSGGGVGSAVTLTGVDAPAVLADASANPTTYRFGAEMLVFNGATWDRVREVSADALAALGLLPAQNLLFNGATWDRMRVAPTADGVGVIGLNAGGILGFNGATWDRLRSNALQELLISQRASGAPAQTSVAQNAASVTILAANAARKMASVRNDAAAGNLFLSWVTPATITAAEFVQLVPNAYYELPSPCPTATLYGIWDAAGAGNARIVEYT